MLANPACGQLNRKNKIKSCPRSRLRLMSRDTGSAVPPRVSSLIYMNRQQHPSVRERATFGTSGPVPADFLMEMECIGSARNYTTYHLGTALEADDIGGIIWN